MTIKAGSHNLSYHSLRCDLQKRDFQQRSQQGLGSEDDKIDARLHMLCLLSCTSDEQHPGHFILQKLVMQT